LQQIEGKLLDWQARGLVAYRSAGRNLCVSLASPTADAHERIAGVLDALEAAQDERLRTLFACVEARGCRHAEFARYFGVPGPGACEAWDGFTRSKRETPAPFVGGAGVSLIDRVQTAIAAFRNA
jgi:hypothetical protein